MAEQLTLEQRRDLLMRKKELLLQKQNLSGVQRPIRFEPQGPDTLDRSISGAALSAIAPPLGAMYQASRLAPAAFQRGGFVDRNVLSGQIPNTGAAVGELIGNIPGAAGGAMVGRSVQDLTRALVGLDRPQSLQQSFTNQATALGQGATSAMAGQAGTRALQLTGQGLGAVGNVIRNAPGIKQTVDFLKRSAGNIAQSLSTSAVPQTTTQVAKALQEGNPTLGEEMARRGIYGFRKKIGEIALQKQRQIGQQIEDTLAQYGDAGIDPKTLVKELDEIEARFLRTGNNSAAKIIGDRKAQWLANVLNKESKLFTGTADEAVKNGLLNASQANILKREFAAEARSVFNQENYDAVSGVNAEFAHAMSSALRKEIEKVAPEIRKLNKDYHFFDEFADAIYIGIARNLNKGVVSIASPMTTAGATGAGYMVTGGPVGAAIAGGTTQLSKSYPVQSYLAAQLSKFAGQRLTPELASEVSSQVLGHPTLRNAVFRALSRVGTYQALDKKEKK